jgi:hypothetical protein
MVKKSPGHIEQLPSGSWRVKVYGGTDPLTGREIRLRKTCKTERAALIELGKLLEQAAAGRQPETNATVAELMDHYAEVADWDLSTRKASCARCRSATLVWRTASSIWRTTTWWSAAAGSERTPRPIRIGTWPSTR